MLCFAVGLGQVGIRKSILAYVVQVLTLSPSPNPFKERRTGFFP